MRIIFLGINGVLNSKAWIDKRGDMEDRFEGNQTRNEAYHSIDPETVERLNTIIEKTGACVVITSTWRKSLPIPEIYGLMCARGFNGEVIGCTPILASTRGREIHKWLGAILPTEPNGIVIIDSDADVGILEKRLVQCAPGVGLQDEQVDSAVELFTK